RGLYAGHGGAQAIARRRAGRRRAREAAGHRRAGRSSPRRGARAANDATNATNDRPRAVGAAARARARGAAADLRTLAVLGRQRGRRGGRPRRGGGRRSVHALRRRRVPRGVQVSLTRRGLARSLVAVVLLCAALGCSEPGSSLVLVNLSRPTGSAVTRGR